MGKDSIRDSKKASQSEDDTGMTDDATLFGKASKQIHIVKQLDRDMKQCLS